MAKARDTSTDRLSNVIEVVELGRRTGLLSAERGTGAYVDEGEIYFVSGRAIYAATSRLRGRDALAELGQWGACRFAFDTDAPRPTPNLAAASMPAGVPPDRGPPSPPRGTGILPRGTTDLGWRTPPSQPTYSPPSAPAAPAPPNNPKSGVWGVSQPGTGSRGVSQPGTGGWGGSQPGTGGWGGSQPGNGTGGDTGPLGRKPRRSPDVRDLMTVVTAHNLSRSHRTILLLADGTHNVLDLARLASKSVDEVTQLLAELEARGLIYYYS